MDPSSEPNTNSERLPSATSIHPTMAQMEGVEEHLEITNTSDQISKKQLTKNTIITKVLPGGSIVYERTESGEIVASIVRNNNGNNNTNNNNNGSTNNNNNNNNNNGDDGTITSSDSKEIEKYIKQAAKKALQQSKKKKQMMMMMMAQGAIDEKDQMKKKRKKRIPNAVEGPSRPGLICPINDRNVENVLDRTLLVTESLQQVLNNFKDELKRVGGGVGIDSKPVGLKKRIEIADKLTNAYIDYQQAIDDIGELGKGYDDDDDDDDDDEDDDEEEEEEDDGEEDNGRLGCEDDFNYEADAGTRINKQSKNKNSTKTDKKRPSSAKRLVDKNDDDDDDDDDNGVYSGMVIDNDDDAINEDDDDDDEDFELKKRYYQSKTIKKQQQQQIRKSNNNNIGKKQQQQKVNRNTYQHPSNNNNNNNNNGSRYISKNNNNTDQTTTKIQPPSTTTSTATSASAKFHHLNEFFATKKSWIDKNDSDGRSSPHFGQQKSKDTKFWYDNCKQEETTNVSDDLWMSCEPGSDDEVLYNVGFPKISDKRK